MVAKFNAFNALNRVMINLYLITALLSIYTPMKVIMLYGLALLNIYFSTLFFLTMMKNNFYMNKYLFLMLVSLICSFFINGHFDYVMLNIMTICGVYYLIYKEHGYVISKLRMYIIIASIINFLLYHLMPPDYIGVKAIGNFLIPRVQLDVLPLSIASAIALLSFIIAGQLKNRTMKYSLWIMNLILIIKLGKLSVIVALILVYLVCFLIVFLRKIMNKVFLKKILKLIYSVMFLFPFLLVYFKQYLSLWFLRLLTFRDDIYISFIDYTMEYGSFLFGAGFSAHEGNLLLLHSNPHNQSLGVFFVLGAFGLMVFLLTFLKVLDNTFDGIEGGDTHSFKIFFAISLLMMIDSYFVLTVFPLYLLFFIFYLMRLSPVIGRTV